MEVPSAGSEYRIAEALRMVGCECIGDITTNNRVG
jgi:hypothetical protein